MRGDCAESDIRGTDGRQSQQMLGGDTSSNLQQLDNIRNLLSPVTVPADGNAICLLPHRNGCPGPAVLHFVLHCSHKCFPLPFCGCVVLNNGLAQWRKIRLLSAWRRSSESISTPATVPMPTPLPHVSVQRRFTTSQRDTARNGRGHLRLGTISQGLSAREGAAGPWIRCWLTWSDMLACWNGRALPDKTTASCEVWIGSYSTRKHFAFRRSALTQRLQFSRTWHGRSWETLIMQVVVIRRAGLWSRNDR